jgi:hypothetical protein
VRRSHVPWLGATRSHGHRHNSDRSGEPGPQEGTACLDAGGTAAPLDPSASSTNLAQGLECGHPVRPLLTAPRYAAEKIADSALAP